MAVQRIDDVTDPVVGRYYLVPTVLARWYDKLDEWPVIGPKHRDKDCFNFDHLHYHFDARFMPAPRVRTETARQWYWRSVIGAPLMTGNGLNPEGLPDPVYRRLRCKRSENPVQMKTLDEQISKPRSGMRCLAEDWQGQLARHNGMGWVCPHRNVPLMGQPVVDGIIVCPAHLLRIDAETGRVLPPAAVQVSERGDR